MQNGKFVSRALLGVLLFAGLSVSADGHGPVFELRTYTANEGKLEARFRDHTMRLFEQHGMRNIGYWKPVDQPNTLIYIIEHETREKAPTNWRAFGTDPAWQKVFQDSRKDGPLIANIVSVYMSATDYSPID